MAEEYIKKEDAIQSVVNHDLVKGEWSRDWAEYMLEDAKPADVTPVVRCKDCKGSEVFQNDSSGVMARYCKVFTLKRMVADDDFCSYGERKDDDN